MALTVIGAGLGRTGTASLKVALENLGVGRCYHMAEVMQNPDAPGHWIEAADGRADWDKIFDGYGATTDYPACSFWHELSEKYPDAKVLLSTRSVDSWIESTQSTIFSRETVEFMFSTPHEEFFRKTAFCHGEYMHDHDYMRRYFKDHEEQVKSTVPPDRLLVYEVTQGWEPLCEFLDVPVPDIPFPHVNSRDEFRDLLDSIKAKHAEKSAVDNISEHAGEFFVDRKKTS
jgi:hypothetical protein